MYSFRTENIKHKISKGHNLKKERSIDHDRTQFLDSKKNIIHALEIAKRPSLDLGKTSQKKGQNVKILTGISSLVWIELDKKKHKWNAVDDTAQFKDQTTNAETISIYFD